MALKDVKEKIEKTAKEAAEGIKSGAECLKEETKDLVRDLKECDDNCVENIKSAANTASKKVSNAGKKIAESEIGQTISDAVDNIKENGGNAIHEVIDETGKSAKEAFNSLKETLTGKSSEEQKKAP